MILKCTTGPGENFRRGVSGSGTGCGDYDFPSPALDPEALPK